MALNITFDGYCYLGDGSLSNSNVKYQAYFYRTQAGSSPSKWNNVRVVESTGYFSFNLGDGDFLTQDGSANNGDRVVVAFWRMPGNRLDNCSVIQEWGAFEIILAGGASFYTRQVQIRPNILPNLNWTFPSSGLVGVNYSSTNNSNDEHSWIWMGTTMNHWHTRYGQTIFSINKINNTDYYWGDGYSDLNLVGAAIASHSWSVANDYVVTIVIEDECGGTVTGTKDISVKYPAPIPNITCHQANSSNQIEIPDTVVTFEYSGTNPYNRIIGIDWVIYDETNSIHTNVSVSGVVNHPNGQGTSWYLHSPTQGAFTKPGIHTVAIVVHWNDGFEEQITHFSKNFNQLKFSGPVVDFIQNPSRAIVASGVVFRNISTNTNRVGQGFGPPPGVQYDWIWNDDGDVVRINNVGYSYELVDLPASDNCTVQLCAHWHDGWDEQISCIEKDVVFAVSVSLQKTDCYYDLAVYGTSDDGSVSGYHWEISRSTSSGSGGPWDVIWTSPIATNQKYKTICFTELNYFLIEAFVHGISSTVSAVLEFLPTEICPEECVLVIWNGTGFDDVGGDWAHVGYGLERTYAKYSGTYGLDATDFSYGKKIMFNNPHNYNFDQFDLLSFYINVKTWQHGRDVAIYFNAGVSVNLSAYIDLSKIDIWQRVLISFADLGLVRPIEVKRLTFESKGNIGFYLDDVLVTVGAITTKVIAIDKPKLTAEPQDTPLTRAQGVDYRPGMSAFPPPGNV